MTQNPRTLPAGELFSLYTGEGRVPPGCARVSRDKDGNYLANKRLRDAVHTALVLERPLLVTEVHVDLVEQTPPGMVKIPAGQFRMGSNEQDDEKPVHKENVAAFFLDVTEVTMEQYQACVKAGVCAAPGTTVKWENYSAEDIKKYSVWCNANQRGRAKHPVNCVDYSQAAVYCKWVSKRLPTEAEWEYAARGTDGRKYPWGNQAPGPQLLNACGTECVAEGKRRGMGGWGSMYNADDGWAMTAPVGRFPAGKSPFGVLDMAGNVWEWVDGWYCKDGYKPGCRTNALRVVRGGSWFDFDPQVARAAFRYGDAPAVRYFILGFRCVRTPC